MHGKSTQNGASPDLSAEPLARRPEVQSGWAHSREDTMRSLPKRSGQIDGLGTPQLRAVPAPRNVLVTAKVVVTTAGHSVEVVQRPHDGPQRWHQVKESLVVDKAGNPVEIDDVAIRNLIQEHRR